MDFPYCHHIYICILNLEVSTLGAWGRIVALFFILPFLLIYYCAYSEHRVGSAAFQAQVFSLLLHIRVQPWTPMLFFSNLYLLSVESLTFLFQSINLSPDSQRSNPASSAPWWFICLILCLVVHVYFFYCEYQEMTFIFCQCHELVLFWLIRTQTFWIMVKSFKNGYPNLPALCLQRKESKAGPGQSFVP